MIRFIKERFFELDPDVDINIAYEDYEKESMMSDIDSFSSETGIDKEIIVSILSQYFINPKQVTKENIRLRLSDMGLGLLKMTSLINKILVFVNDMSNKYTAEGV